MNRSIAVTQNLGWKPYIEPVLIYMCSRLVIFLGVLFGKTYIPLGNDTWLGGNRWYHNLLRWDSEWYKIIASEGYAYNGDPDQTQTVVFYPLYPALSRLFSEILRIDIIDAMLLVSNLAALAAIILLFKLAREEFGDRTALISVTMISFFPASVFLSAGYTESLALLLIVSFFLMIAREQFFAAALFAGLALATRSSGVILFPVLLCELWRRHAPKQFFMEVVPLSIVATSGLWLYVIYLGVAFHHPMAFADGQAAFHENTDMSSRLLSALMLQPFGKMDLVNVSPAGLDQWFTLIFTGLIACSWFTGISRGMTMFALMALALPYFTLSGGPAGFTSMGRFNIVSFPLFIVMALLIDRQRWLIPGVTGVFGGLLLIYAALFAQWQWVGLAVSKRRVVVSPTPPPSRDVIRPSYAKRSARKRLRKRNSERDCASATLRAWGTPGARCARSLACKINKAHEHSHHGHTGSPGVPTRFGFNGFLRDLLGDRACLPPSPASCVSMIADLTPASGRRDHTTSPSATHIVRQRCVCVQSIPPLRP